MVGNGNVAIDVARMLALTAEELAGTDTIDPAIEAIVGSRLREIVMLGRRGPVQAAFTPPELGELGELAGADVLVDPADLDLDAASAAALEEDRVRARRNFDLLREYSAREPAGRPRRIVLRFLVSPVRILGDERVEAVEVVRNRLEQDAGGRIVAVPTGDPPERIACGIVFRSVGYRGTALPGLPFDESRATLRNDGGRVLGDDGTPVPGVYAAGWIKRGPTGVIGTNKKDAAETVEALLADARAGALPSTTPDTMLDELLAERGVQAVTYEGWEAINAAERAAGEPLGRPRVKLARWEQLLQVGTPAPR